MARKDLIDHTLYEAIRANTNDNFIDLYANKVNTESGKGLSSNDFTTAQKNKLEGLPNHDGYVAGLLSKVNTVAGKELSSNDFTDTLKDRLENDCYTADGTVHINNIPIIGAGKTLKDSGKTLSDYVLTVTGKDLSSNDFTDAIRDKVVTIEQGNYHAEWSQALLNLDPQDDLPQGTYIGQKVKWVGDETETIPFATNSFIVWLGYWDYIGNVTTAQLNDAISSAGTDYTSKAVYDPTGVNDDAFSMDKMVETSTKKVLTDTERAAIVTNSNKVGITVQQANDIISNNEKVSNVVQTSVTGNAGTTTRLATPVKIAGKDFDGTADVSIASIDLTDGNELATESYVSDMIRTPTYTPELTNVNSIHSNGTGYEGDYAIEDGFAKTDKVVGNTVVNSMANGDFSDGTTGWTGSSVSGFTVNDGVAEFTATASGGNIYSVDLANNNVWLAVFYIKCDCLANEIQLSLEGGVGSKFYQGGNVWEFVVSKIDLTSGNYGLRIRDGRASAWTKVFIDYSYAIKMTGMYYENYTEEQMLDLVSNGYIDGMQGTGAKKITSRGKNKFDDISTEALNLSTISKVIEDGRNCLYSSRADYLVTKPLIVSVFKPNTQYVCKFEIKGTDNNACAIGFVYTDGTTSYSYNGSTNWATKTIVSNIGKSVDSIRSMTYGSATDFIYLNLDTLQIEEGTTATAYEPYKTSSNYIPELNQLPNSIADTWVNGLWTKNIKEYVLTEDDIDNLYKGFTTIDIIVTGEDCLSGLYEAGETDNYGLKAITIVSHPWNNQTPQDQESNAWTHKFGNGLFEIMVPKGTYTDLAEAKTALAGTRILYQLAEPIVTRTNSTALMYYTDGDTITEDKFSSKWVQYGTGIDLTNTGYDSQTISLAYKATSEGQQAIDVSSFVNTNNVFTSTDCTSDDYVWVEVTYTDSNPQVTSVTTLSMNVAGTIEQLSTTAVNQKKAIDSLTRQVTKLMEG